jgi:NAD(P)-dependent dehydrogenase (short-subunit alcohol dehydrogenase family)
MCAFLERVFAQYRSAAGNRSLSADHRPQRELATALARCLSGSHPIVREDAMPEGQSHHPPQEQERQPGLQSEMRPPPQAEMRSYRAAGKLAGKVALITGGDSGIGRAVAIGFAKEGADVAIVYLDEHRDAESTKGLVEEAGRRCLTLAGDIGDHSFCRKAVEETVSGLGRLDVLVNNAAVQYPQERLEDISAEQMERTFKTNIFAMFHLTKAALPHLGKGATIVNTTSVTAYRGSAHLIDYASTKGAIVAFTRSLAQHLTERGIRVNAVAPGPVWTPLIPASFPAEKVEGFGANTFLGRPPEPDEIAPCYIFLASDDSAVMTGQVLHPNGGEIVGG